MSQEDGQEGDYKFSEHEKVPFGHCQCPLDPQEGFGAKNKNKIHKNWGVNSTKYSKAGGIQA